MTGPGDEVAVAAGGPGHLRASHADREQVIDTLKMAFALGRLTKGELDVRVGRALTARTYADLAVVTAGIATRPSLAQPPKPARAQLRQPENRSANRTVKPGVYAITATTLAAGILVGVVVGAAAAVIMAILVLNLTAMATRS